MSDDEVCDPLTLINKQDRPVDTRRQIEHQGCGVGLSRSQRRGDRCAGPRRLRRQVRQLLKLISTFINHCDGTGIGIEQTVTSSRTDRVFIKASFDRYDVEGAASSLFIWQFAESLCLAHVLNGVGKVTVDFTEVFFLAASEHPFAAEN